MAYYINQEKKIAAPIAYIALTVLLVGVSLIMTQLTLTTSSRASKTAVAKDVIVSNRTTTGSSISTITNEPSTVQVYYWQGNSPKLIAFDTRDAAKAQQRLVHYISLSGLEPNTTYSYQIVLNGVTEKQIRQFTTHAAADIGPAQQPLFGKTLQKNLQPLSEVLVTVTFPKINPKAVFSALSDNSGGWIINVPILLNAAGKPVALTSNDEAKFSFTNGQKQSIVTAPLRMTAPLRSIVVGNNYALDTTDRVLGAEDLKKVAKNLQIISPSDGAVLSSRYITLRGVAKPESTITVRVLPTEETYTTVTKADGTWSVQNTNPLMAKTYTAIAKSSSEDTMTQIKFTIGKDGEQVLGSATQSATITPTITIAPTLQPTISSIIPTPTTMVTAIPTMVVSPTPQIPRSGMNTNLLIIGASTISLLGLVLLLY